jgi:putative transposase
VSLLYKLSRRLLSVPAVLLRRDTSKDAELLALRHENAVLDRRGGDTQHLARRAPAHG